MSYLSTHPTLKLKALANSKKEWYEHSLKRYFPSNKEDAILEIGPGLGEGLKFLIEDLNYKKITAIDIDEDVVKHCKNIVGPKVELVDNIKSFFDKNEVKFKCIIMYHVIEHINKDEIVQTISLIKQALAKGGNLLIVTPNAAAPLIGMDQYLFDFTHKTAFSPNSLEQAIRMSGFTNIEVENIWPPRTNLARMIQEVLQKILTSFVKLYLSCFSRQSRKVMTHQILAVAVND